MKHLLIFMAGLHCAVFLYAQPGYDSITISRFLFSKNTIHANWQDTLQAGRYPHYLDKERTIWVKPARAGSVAPVLALAKRIQRNGTGDISKCFIPRHSINFYSGGKITRYLLVCFECEGVRFSDDPPERFVKKVQKRIAQMEELKTLFKALL